MPAKKTREQIVGHLEEKGMILLSEYTGYDTPVCVKCQDCGHEWSVTPRAVITRGNGKCAKCKPHGLSLSLSDITERLQTRGIRLVGEFKSTGKPVELCCDVCGYEWIGTTTQIIHNGSGCPSCAGNVILDQRTLESRLPKSIRMVGLYVSVDTPVEFMCDAGHTWKATPANYLYSNRCECPVCQPYQHNKHFGKRTVVDGIVFRSRLEAECYSLLTSRGMSFNRQVKYPTLKRMTCDFVIGDMWVEVSSIKKDEYLNKIHRKRVEVEKAGNKFVFVTSLEEFQSVLEH